MNKFGGNWTQHKIEILAEYAKAYLDIMKVYKEAYKWKIMYFDGFAGSGFIESQEGENQKNIIGSARRILEIDQPISFDSYYFVEKNSRNVQQLIANTKDAFPQKIIFVEHEDCNVKLKAMAEYLKVNPKQKVLAYVDPYGMQVDWESLAAFRKSKGLDLWILVPTGMGVNRLITHSSQIDPTWITRLEKFLGLPEKDIRSAFYKVNPQQTLFGDDPGVLKEENVIHKSAELYRERLSTIFDHVSNAYVLRQKGGGTLYHFLMASNNKTAVKIANDIIRKYNQLIP